ncbi:uncharacterized protein LOC144148526 [Haemaphysalis longicornis]
MEHILGRRLSDTQLLETSSGFHDVPKSIPRTLTPKIPDSAIYVGGVFLALLVVAGMMAFAMSLRTTTSRLDLVGTGLPLAGGGKDEDDSMTGHVVPSSSGSAGDEASTHDHEKPSNLGLDSEDTSEERPAARRTHAPKRRRTPARRSHKKPAVAVDDESSEASEATVAVHDEGPADGFEGCCDARYSCFNSGKSVLV